MMSLSLMKPINIKFGQPGLKKAKQMAQLFMEMLMSIVIFFLDPYSICISGMQLRIMSHMQKFSHSLKI